MGWWRAKRRTGTGTPRAVEQRKKRGAGRARDNQDWRNAGKRKGEKQKGPPPLSPITSAPSPIHRRRESCARCKEQDRGWLCCQKNLARLSRLPPPLWLCVLAPTHTPPSFPCLVGTEGGGRSLCSGTANLAENLAEGAGRCGSGASSSSTGLRPKSAPNWVAMMQAQRCIPNPHPRPNLWTHPIQRPNGRDEERSRETDWERTIPHHAIP